MKTYSVIEYKNNEPQFVWKDNMSKEDADNLAEYLNSEADKQFKHLNITFIVE